jgi:hypothetical protein
MCYQESETSKLQTGPSHFFCTTQRLVHRFGLICHTNTIFQTPEWNLKYVRFIIFLILQTVSVHELCYGATCAVNSGTVPLGGGTGVNITRTKQKVDSVHWNPMFSKSEFSKQPTFSVSNFWLPELVPWLRAVVVETAVLPFLSQIVM